MHFTGTMTASIAEKLERYFTPVYAGPGTDEVFEGVRVIDSTVGDLDGGAAFTIPGVGIFMSNDYYSNKPKERKDLLRHEFGHVLQHRRYGTADYSVVAAVSIWSALTSSNSRAHQDTWTEKQANTLSYLYFNMPSDWNTKSYAIDSKYLDAVVKSDFIRTLPK